MRDYCLTHQAENDLVEIIDYISQDNPDAAQRVLESLEEAFAKLAAMPGIGHFREDLLDQRHKFWHVKSYVIVYRWQVKPIQILTVVHGARNLEAFFARRGIGQ